VAYWLEYERPPTERPVMLALVATMGKASPDNPDDVIDWDTA